MRTLRHWSLRYIADRIALAIYERQDPDAPWLTRAMVDILDGWLQKTDVGVEFGSGRSTAWFAARVASLISVEHDQQWSDRVKASLRARRLDSRVTYRLVDHENLEANYLAVLDSIPDMSIDFALIDGIFRDKCAVAAVPKLRQGGVIIVDNVNWYLPPLILQHSPSTRTVEEGPATAEWRMFAEKVSNWRFVWTSNGVSDTALWMKPAVEVDLGGLR